MHGTATPTLPPPEDATAARIARLSEEYLDADPKRREAIGAEISGIISGDVVAMRKAE